MDSVLITGLLNGGVAGIVVLLFVLGLIFPKSVVADLREERDALKTAVANERDRAESAVAAAQASRDLMAALQAGITMARQDMRGINEAAGRGAPPSGGSPP